MSKPYQFFVRGLFQDADYKDLDTPIDHFFFASESSVPYTALDCVAAGNGKTEYLVSSGGWDDDGQVLKFDKVSDALIALAAILKKKDF